MKAAETPVEKAKSHRFADAMAIYCRELEALLFANTKAYPEAGLKILLRTWAGIEALSIRRVTSKMVEEWLGRLKAEAIPYVPTGAKSASRKSTGAGVTTLKCALDAVRQVISPPSSKP